jgi:hypothetical protein
MIMMVLRHLASMVLAVCMLIPMVTACESGQASGDHRQAVARDSLCTSISSLDRLLVQRTVIAAQGTHPRFTFPAQVIVVGAKVPEVAQAICMKSRSLPASTGCPMPAPTSNRCGVVPASPPKFSPPCPVSILIVYRLTFSTAHHRLRSVLADPGVCPQAQLWIALGIAMRLPHPGITSFTGGIKPAS